MRMQSGSQHWGSYLDWLCYLPELGIYVDVSRMDIAPGVETALAAPFAAAFESMRGLEAGAIANPDEGRMVGHYWLRRPELAPTAEVAAAIRAAFPRQHRPRRVRSGIRCPGG